MYILITDRDKLYEYNLVDTKNKQHSMATIIASLLYRLDTFFRRGVDYNLLDKREAIMYVTYIDTTVKQLNKKGSFTLRGYHLEVIDV